LAPPSHSGTLPARLADYRNALSREKLIHQNFKLKVCSISCHAIFHLCAPPPPKLSSIGEREEEEEIVEK
jgi:hypothetical protein